jgi:hypothetical protein
MAIYMKRKHIDASREARLWIGRVIVPAALAVTMIVKDPIARKYIADKKNDILSKLKKK